MNDTLNVLVAYEDLNAEERAKDLLNRLTGSLMPRVRLKLSLWKFSVLGVPPLRDLAVGDANEADVIIISSTQAAEAPTELETWVERWEPRAEGHASALVALSAPGGDDVASLPPVTSFCQELASRNGMDFFCDCQVAESARTHSVLSSRLSRWSRSEPEPRSFLRNEPLSQTTRSSPVNGQCSPHRSMAS